MFGENNNQGEPTLNSMQRNTRNRQAVPDRERGVVVWLDVRYGLVRDDWSRSLTMNGGTGLPRDILLVDDVAEQRDIYASLLRQDGYSVRAAADGGEALVLIQESLPDLVVTDLQMPPGE